MVSGEQTVRERRCKCQSGHSEIKLPGLAVYDPIVAWERNLPRAPASPQRRSGLATVQDICAPRNRDPNDPLRGLQTFLFSVSVLSLV
jgi:hypothetical protein